MTFAVAGVLQFPNFWEREGFRDDGGFHFPMRHVVHLRHEQEPVR